MPKEKQAPKFPPFPNPKPSLSDPNSLSLPKLPTDLLSLHHCAPQFPPEQEFLPPRATIFRSSVSQSLSIPCFFCLMLKIASRLPCVNVTEYHYCLLF
ncbi:hypothetical protein Hanom_Chr09g00780071 [Helianthus anomalus]